MSKVSVDGEVVEQTEKAVLVEVTDTSTDKLVTFWLPKSVVMVESFAITAPLWLWIDRAKAAGVQLEGKNRENRLAVIGG